MGKFYTNVFALFGFFCLISLVCFYDEVKQAIREEWAK